MKYFIILLIGFSFSVFSISAKSQLANWITPGTWQYTNGADTITMYFQQAQQIQIGNESFKTQLGFHRYVKNGIQVETSIGFSGTDFNDNKYSMLLFAGRPNDSKNESAFKDITLNKKRTIYFTKISATKVKIYIGYIHGVYNNAPRGFTLPQHFTLTKQ